MWASDMRSSPAGPRPLVATMMDSVARAGQLARDTTQNLFTMSSFFGPGVLLLLLLLLSSACVELFVMQLAHLIPGPMLAPMPCALVQGPTCDLPHQLLSSFLPTMCLGGVERQFWDGLLGSHQGGDLRDPP